MANFTLFFNRIAVVCFLIFPLPKYTHAIRYSPLDLPPKPSGTRKLVVPDSLQLDWTVPDGEFEHYRLIYSTDGTKEKETTVELSPETTSYLIEGLTGQFYTNLYTIRNGIKSDLGEWRENTDKGKVTFEFLQ